ncbi:BglG family transcription antiterminator [Neobacillus sp. WH10]|uniref:BglG family transcription antiterminator n=1 Tax=Neobacillus sp. WH10 TaxID=3047873 RepID=UPI0024C144AA|nr:BglG family transcription antiterminator [Neobacillus sp. WH10]WHY77354.1 BglG family transcription antiterminator [Neobacillus sp. WH10]
MSLDQRSMAILSYIVKASTYVSLQEISEKFNISRRTIYYDIEKINDWLKENRLQSVKQVRSAGFYLDEETAHQVPGKLVTLKKWHYEYTVKERKAWLAIYLMVLDIPLFLDNLMKKVRVSRNTTIEDLKGLKEELKRFHLVLEFERRHGYVIIGKEDDKRRAIVYYLQHVLPEQGWQALLIKIPGILQENGPDILHFFEIEKWKAVQLIIAESEEDLNIQFTDEFLDNFALRLLFFYKRFSQGKKVSIDPVEKDVLRDTKQFRAAEKIARKLSALFEVDFPEEEVFYITKHLLGSRIQFSEEVESTSNDFLKDVVTNMVSDFQRFACVFFENRQEIERNLLLHVKTAYFRVKYGLEVENDMTKAIIEKYHDIFLITKKSMFHLENLIGKAVNDDETALIAMHFGGWMKRVGAEAVKRKTALLVCTNGIGTSRLLQRQLEGLFSTIDIIGCVSLREYESNQFEADFIISTIPLQKKTKPVFVVSPILTEAEKESLLKKVNAQLDFDPKQTSAIDTLMDIIQKYADVRNETALQTELKQYLAKPLSLQAERPRPSLKELLMKEHIQLRQEVPTWEEAIWAAAEPLKRGGFVTDHYIESMVQNIKNMGPYIVIAPMVALPHAKPEDGVQQLGMSLLKLDKPVLFMDKEVRLLIVLAAIDGDSHLKAVSQLTNLLSKPNQINKILEAEFAINIFDIIKAYSV